MISDVGIFFPWSKLTSTNKIYLVQQKQAPKTSKIHLYDCFRSTDAAFGCCIKLLNKTILKQFFKKTLKKNKKKCYKIFCQYKAPMKQFNLCHAIPFSITGSTLLYIVMYFKRQFFLHKSLSNLKLGFFHCIWTITHLVFTYPKLTTETLEAGVKYVQS